MRPIEFETDLLTALVERKQTCLEQLLELGRQQCALVEIDDMTTLLQVLSVKQQMIAQLQQIERQLDPFRVQRPEDRRWRDESVRLRCSETLMRTEQLLAAVLQCEKQAEQSLQQRRDETAARLANVSHAQRARGAYCVEPPRHSTRLDLLSP
jgi:hypothetical protein